MDKKDENKKILRHCFNGILLIFLAILWVLLTAKPAWAIRIFSEIRWC